MTHRARALVAVGSLFSMLSGCSNSAEPPQGTGGGPAQGGAAPQGGASPFGGAAGAGQGGSTPSTGGGSPAGASGASTGGSAGVITGGVSGAAGSGADAGTAGSDTTGGMGGSDTTGGMGGTPGGTGGAGGTAGVSGGSGGRGGIGNAGSSGAGGSGGTSGGRSAGCGKAVTRPDPNTQYTMQVSGTTRYFLIYVPTNYDPATALPVVFAFHGLDMNNWWAAHDQSGFRLIEASNNRAILVYPQGSGEAPGTTSRWGNINSSWSSGGGDLAFVDALVTDVQNKYCVDPSRVFSTGFSQGGMMTNALGCQRASVFRGIAPVSGWGPGGSPVGGGMGSCSDANARPAVLVSHGTSDSVVNISAGRASRDFWRGRNGCMTTSMPGLNNCVLYQGCMAGRPVGYCEHSGDHAPASNTGANVWAFFSSIMN